MALSVVSFCRVFLCDPKRVERDDNNKTSLKRVKLGTSATVVFRYWNYHASLANSHKTRANARDFDPRVPNKENCNSYLTSSDMFGVWSRDEAVVELKNL